MVPSTQDGVGVELAKVFPKEINHGASEGVSY